MKKILKIIWIIIVLLMVVYVLFVAEELIRLKSGGQHPLIIIRNGESCDGDKIERVDKYTTNCKSLGFRLEREYILDEKSSEDNRHFTLIREEFWLFDVFKF